MKPIIRQYSIISAAIILMLGLEIFVPWPWSIMGGLVMILMVPILLKYTIMDSLSNQGYKFGLQCVSRGTKTRDRTCPKCGQSVFRPT